MWHAAMLRWASPLFNHHLILTLFGVSTQLGLLISGQVNRLTGQIILTTCSGQNYLYWLNKSQ